MELVEFILFCQSFVPSLCHIFYSTLEKIINKEYPCSVQDGGRQALDGRLPTLFKSHKGRDGLQGGHISRVGSILGDDLSDRDGYGDDRIDRVAGHNPMLP